MRKIYLTVNKLRWKKFKFHVRPTNTTENKTSIIRIKVIITNWVFHDVKRVLSTIERETASKKTGTRTRAYMNTSTNKPTHSNNRFIRLHCADDFKTANQLVSNISLADENYYYLQRIILNWKFNTRIKKETFDLKNYVFDLKHLYVWFEINM